MKKKFHRALLVITLVALIVVGFTLLVSADDTDTGSSTVLYEILNSEGEVVESITETKTTQQLVDLAVKVKGGGTVKLYTDVQMYKGTSIGSTNSVIFDLNTHTVTNENTDNNSGTYERFVLSGTASLTVKNGTIEVSDNDFIYTGNSATTYPTVTIENCVIKTKRSIFHFRDGEITLKDCKIYSTATSGNFITMSAAGTKTKLVFDNCTTVGADLETVGNMKQSLVSVARKAIEAKREIVIKDSTLRTTEAILLYAGTAFEHSTVKLEVLGSTSLKYQKGQIGEYTNTIPGTAKYVFESGVKLSSLPNDVDLSNLLFADRNGGFVTTDDATYPYEAKKFANGHSIVKPDGTWTYVQSTSSFNDLVSAASDGSTIILYEDVDVVSACAVKSSLTFDLNDYKITNTNGAITVKTADVILTFRNGFVERGSGNQYFILTSEGAASETVQIIFDDCDITSYQSFSQQRNGTYEFRNCTVNCTGPRWFLIWSAAGYSTNVKFDNSIINITNADSYLVDCAVRDVDGKEVVKTLTLNDTVINAAGKLFDVAIGSTGEPVAGSSVNFNFTGETKVECTKFGLDTNLYKGVNLNFGEGVLTTCLPEEMEFGSIGYKDGAEGFADYEHDTYKYAVSSEIFRSLKPQFALLLYTDFTLNLSFPQSNSDKIISVNFGGETLNPIFTQGRMIYRIGGIAPFNATTPQKITVQYKNLDKTFTKEVEYSITDYIKALYATNYSTESKQMISRTLDYIAAAYDVANLERPQAVSELLASNEYAAIGNSGVVSKVPSSTVNIGSLGNVIDGAQLSIGDNVYFRFYLKDGIGSGKLTVKSETFNKEYTVVDGLVDGEGYFIVDMRAYSMYDDIITITFGEYSGNYDFKFYANSDEVKDRADLEPFILAFYNYCRESSEYTNVAEKDFVPAAQVVLKDGKNGAVSYVIDDGKLDTGRNVSAMLDKYENLKVTFALVGDYYATLKTKHNELGKLEYVIDENGNYVYTVKEGEGVEFWRGVIEKYAGRVEYANHTFTHKFAGYNDDGGEISYVTTDGEVKTIELVAGSASAQYLAAVQVLEEIFGTDVETIAAAGIAAKANDVTIDGVTYPGYATFARAVINEMYEDGILVAIRNSSFVESGLNESKVILPSEMKYAESRLDISCFSVRNTDSLDSWKRYIDYAVEQNGLAVFGMHYISEIEPETSKYKISPEVAEQLFAYTNREDIWVATFAEATKYFSEWSTASVSVEYANGGVNIVLTDGENNETYDEALTVKVTVPSSWEKCMTNTGEVLNVMRDDFGECYVYVNIVPDSGTVTLNRNVSDYSYDYENDSDGELKVLFIGNSYGLDTTRHSYEIFQDVGIENVTVARLYIANCSVQEHYANLTRSDEEYEANPPSEEVKRWRYVYTVNSTGEFVTYRDYLIKDAILAEDWDIITFQHTSYGELEAEAVPVLQMLANEVRNYCPDAVFMWNMTWARANENTASQINKYNKIVSNVKTNIVSNSTFEFISPVGTAIQNARTSSLGDTFNRDNEDASHLSYGKGCYTAALTYVGAITGRDISKVTWRPTNGVDAVSEYEQKIAIEAAVNALENPFNITQSEYK